MGIKLQSDFALLDVKRGRKKLLKLIGFAGSYLGGPKRKPIPVIIHGEITGAWGYYDGISQEFEVIVKKVEVNDLL